MVGKQESMRAWLRDAFSIDTRSIGVFRIGLGIFLLWDLADRLPDISSHYTDNGLFPREILENSFWNLGWQLSIHSLSGGAFWQTTLFLAAATAAIILIIGWKSKWVIIVSWVLLCSLHARNPAVLHGGDALLRVLLFFSIFLPLDARFAWKSKASESDPTRIVNAASCALFIQIAAVYQFSLFFKTDPMWRETFDALYYTLNYDFIAKPLASRLVEWPTALRGLTVLTLLLEALGPILIVISARRPKLRTAVILCFMLFHAMIWSTIAIGSFSFVCMLAWILFLPSAFWDRFLANSNSTVTTTVHGGIASQTIATIAIALIVTWNILLLDKNAKSDSLPGWIKAAVRTPMLNQRWMAFSNENGLRWSGWMLIEGTAADGQKYDLLDGRNLTGEPSPNSLHDRFPSERWRKGIRRHLSRSATREDHERLCRFFIQRWNDQNPDIQIQQTRIMYRIRWVYEPGTSPKRGKWRDYVFFDTES